MDEFDWHAYITETPYERFRNSKEFVAFMRLCDAWQRLAEFSHGDLRYKNVPKQVIAEQTQKVAVQKGYPPYSFRFQCLTTGRVSRFIKQADYSKFGILPQDAQTGGPFVTYAEVEDRLAPIRESVLEKMKTLRETAMPSSDGGWWDRYSQYLQSEQWSNIRQVVFKRDDFKCVVSGDCDSLQVHHIHYKRVGCELLGDLVTLSRSVHEAVHDPAARFHGEYRRKLRAVADLNWEETSEEVP